jgi:hypothetical protein
MKIKVFSIFLTVLTLVLLLGGFTHFAQGRLQTAAAAGGAGYVNVPASAFAPASDDINYILDEFGLKLRTDSTSGQFFAPVYLPHGASLSKLTFYRYDMIEGILPYCYLRTLQSSTFATTAIAAVYTDDPTYNGWNDISTTEFSDPVVDNSQYFYSLQCYLSRIDESMLSVLVGLRIEYTYPVYLPVTSK